MKSDATKSGTVTRTLALTGEETAELLAMLKEALGDARVEMHHTHTPDFRDKVRRREDVLRGLLEKLAD